MKAVLNLMVLASLFSAACSEEAKIEQKAIWLCERSHMRSPVPDAFPEDHAPSDYIASVDLAALTRKDDAKTGMFAALAQGLKKVGIGSREALAEHTECKVKSIAIEDSGARAQLTVEETRPKWTMPDGLEKLGELSALESSDEVRRKVSDMIKEANPTRETVETKMIFVKEDGRWVALFEIAKIRQRAEIDEEIKVLAEKLEITRELVSNVKDATNRLIKLEVKSAKFSKVSVGFGDKRPMIELIVRNNTGGSLASASFVGRLQSPGRDVPWVEESFSYSIPGGLQAGEDATWTLAPNMFSEWGSVEAPADAELHVSVTRLEGPEAEVVAELPRDKASFERKPLSLDTLEAENKRLEAELEELRAKLVALQ